MQYIEWTPQVTINPPVYLDANIIIGSIVNTHRLYPTCVNLTANLLISKSTVLISPVTLNECLWAVSKLAYCQLSNNRPNANWNMSIYMRWLDRIFASYGAWITAVGTMIRDWSNVGVPIEVIPKTDILWGQVTDLTPSYMQDLKLCPADAIHLALAETHAQTFVTADSDFEEVRKNPPSGKLVIIHIA